MRALAQVVEQLACSASRCGLVVIEKVLAHLGEGALLRNSTYCLVLRGDTPSTRKFSEAILGGCVPVLIADMPAWPFDTRLRYGEFSYEFDWRHASVCAPSAPTPLPCAWVL